MVRLYGDVSQRVDDTDQHHEVAIQSAFHETLVLQRITWLVNGVVMALCIVALSIIAVALTRALILPLQSAIRIADQVAAGDMTVEIPEASDDEVGHLLDSMRGMVAYLGGMASIADGIAQGDTLVGLGERSERD
jgi:methyl-accepting chemotaxis protein